MTAARAAALVLVLGALAWASAPQAQNAGPRANGGVASQGAMGGGASGSANRGGAGAMANPSPGALPGDAGSSGESRGPVGTTTRRSGYLGGRATSPEATTPSASVIGTAGSGSATLPSCNEVNVAGMSPSARLSGPNAERVDLATGVVGASAAHASNRYLMANFQEELAKADPDLELAGTYLGIAARDAVTPEVVQRVSELLCVPLGAEQARNVSAAAAGQRGRAAGAARR